MVFKFQCFFKRINIFIDITQYSAGGFLPISIYCIQLMVHEYKIPFQAETKLQITTVAAAVVQQQPSRINDKRRKEMEWIEQQHFKWSICWTHFFFLRQVIKQKQKPSVCFGLMQMPSRLRATKIKPNSNILYNTINKINTRMPWMEAYLKLFNIP